MFPKEMPVTAFRQLARFFTGTDKDTGRLSLAIYDLVGYGLGNLFPNAAYVSDATPPDPVAAVTALATADPDLVTLSPELEQLLQLVGPLLLKLLFKRLGL